MFNHDLVKIENLKTEELNGKRFYVAPDGNRYPSVTTITGWKKRAFFAEWRKKNPEESRRVLSRGTSFHTIIENHLLNDVGAVEEKKQNRPGDYYLFAQIRQELAKINNIKALETALWSGTLRMAGRVDCIAMHEGKLAVIDFKGSTRNKKKSEIENYFLQASAYSMMFQEMTGIKVPDIKILLASEEGICQVFEDKVINNVPRLKEVIDTYFDYIRNMRNKNEATTT